MTDTGLFTDLLNEALENPVYILFGIGFILLCIFVGLLNRKARKANPEKYARVNASINATTATTSAPDNPTRTVFVGGKMYTTTTVGDTTYIN